MSTYNRLDFRIIRILTHYAQKLPGIDPHQTTYQSNLGVDQEIEPLKTNIPYYIHYTKHCILCHMVLYVIVVTYLLTLLMNKISNFVIPIYL